MIRMQSAQRVFELGEQRVHALDGIDLRVERGEYMAIVGPSGSGKSTLLNALGLLDRLDAGRYELDGHDVTALDDDALTRLRREHIGFVFQFFHLVPRLTAIDNVALPLVLAGVAPARRLALASAALQSVGVWDRARHRPAELSGGQRQRVAIARATIMEPHLLLADEPTGNLDSESGRSVIELLEKRCDAGLSLLVVTHDPLIARRARRLLRMVDGRIVEDRRQ
ncbi:MAG: ABC transporter ATP-binding protein [Gammaproteobacteria bacterium]|nr:ABC transporter ATP-binding protein [Gammaproteobacteria bacterium]